MRHQNRRFRLPTIGLLFSLLAIGSFVGCATIPPAQNEERVGEVIELVDSLNADQSLAQSGRPFLFDSEVIELSNDLFVMWRNIYNAGFSLPGATILSLQPVDSQTYLRYGDSDELRAFFQRHVPPESTVARVRARQGTFELILGDERGGMPRIYGLRGPI